MALGQVNKKIIIQNFGLQNLGINKYTPGVQLANGKAFLPPFGVKPTVKQGQQDEPLYRSGFLGTPVWSNLVIEAQSYTDPVTGAVVEVPQFIFDTVLIVITRKHNIIRTPVQGLDGTIKEYIAKGDWDINIKGGIFGSVNRRPTDDISKLKQIEAANIALTVQSPFFKEFDINSIVIDSATFPQIAGGYAYQMFDINAISDVPVILQMK